MWKTILFSFGVFVSQVKPQGTSFGADTKKLELVTGRGCQICQLLAHDVERAFDIHVGKNLMKESEAIKHIYDTKCNRAAMETRMRSVPTDIATHSPSLQWDCEQILYHIGQPILDALSVDEEVDDYCWSYESGRICKRGEPKLAKELITKYEL